MISFGILELMMIAVIGVVFIPPHKLPELMRGLGRLLAQLKQYQHELRRMMNHFEAWQDHCQSEARSTEAAVRLELERTAREMAPADSTPLDQAVEDDVGDMDDADQTHSGADNIDASSP